MYNQADYVQQYKICKILEHTPDFSETLISIHS